MAKFKYIGTLTKPDGTISVRVPCSDGTTRIFDGVVPDQTVIDVGNDPKSIKALEYSVDPGGSFIYLRIE